MIRIHKAEGNCISTGAPDGVYIVCPATFSTSLLFFFLFFLRATGAGHFLFNFRVSTTWFILYKEQSVGRVDFVVSFFRVLCFFAQMPITMVYLCYHKVIRERTCSLVVYASLPFYFWLCCHCCVRHLLKKLDMMCTRILCVY